jgi:hypothetical protein
VQAVGKIRQQQIRARLADETFVYFVRFVVNFPEVLPRIFPKHTKCIAHQDDLILLWAMPFNIGKNKTLIERSKKSR